MSSLVRSFCSLCSKLTNAPSLIWTRQVLILQQKCLTSGTSIQQPASMFHTSSVSANQNPWHDQKSIFPPDGTCKGGDGPDRYEPNSPYRQPWPHRQDYKYSRIYTGGLLPRSDPKRITSLRFKTRHVTREYKHEDNWTPKKALFGQNDYIDLLSDFKIHPVDLIHGPKWLVGFKGTEYQRLLRELTMYANWYKEIYPTKYQMKMKRLRFLYKKLHNRRGNLVRKKKYYL